MSIGYWLLTVAGLMLCPALWHVIRGCERTVLARFAILGTFYVAIVYTTSYTGVGRLGSIRNPNAVGLILLGVSSAALAIRPLAIRFVCLGMCILLLLATQSRAAMIGTLLMLTIYVALEWGAIGTAWKSLVVFGLCVGLVLCSGSLVDSLGQFAEHTLRLDERSRGINSGFSGRTALWQLTYEVWLSNPLVGIGYRAHEFYPGLEMGSHNGYLALLAETGIIGTIPVLVLFVLGLGELIRQARAGEFAGKVGTALVVGYLFHGFFERYTINFGNPTSVLALMFLFVPRVGGWTRGLVVSRRLVRQPRVFLVGTKHL
jgi:O-antigen ligase